MLEAKPASNGNHSAPLKEEESVEELSKAVAKFQSNYAETVHRWNERLRASARAVGVRDLGFEFEMRGLPQYHRHPRRDRVHCGHQPTPPGQVLPGSGKLIVAPGFLQEYRPDVVIAMNPIYLDEIRNDLNSLGLNPELTAV